MLLKQLLPLRLLLLSLLLNLEYIQIINARTISGDNSIKKRDTLEDETPAW